MSTGFDDSMRLAIFRAIIRNCIEFDPSMTSVGVTKEDGNSWSPLFSSFIKKTKRLQNTTGGIKEQYGLNLRS